MVFKHAEKFRHNLYILEASKGGMKVGRIKDPLYKDSYFGITPPTFILPFEAPEYHLRGLGDVAALNISKTPHCGFPRAPCPNF